MADEQDLGSCVFWRVGSNPIFRILYFDMSHTKKLMMTLIMASSFLVILFLILRAAGDSGQPVLSFSRESGFYDDPFYLEMDHSNGTVYYTLDCSRPDETSMLYTQPILIDDASQNENLYSMRTDVAVFDRALVKERDAGTPEDYVVPDSLVDKCTVVRAVCIDELGGRSGEVSGVFFVGYDERPAYDGLSVVSLYTAPENLFDHEDGIYVTGKVMEDYLKKGERVENDGFWWWWPANYRMKGMDWEREAVIEIFDKDRERIMAKNVGIRIQGGGSRAYLPRSLNVYARKDYDGTEVFDEGLFGLSYPQSSFTVFSGGDSRVTKLEDYIPGSLAAGLDISTMHFEPAAVFLEGEFWGFNYITERYDEAYFAGHYGIDEDNIVMIKEGEVSLGYEKDIKLYEDDLAFLKSVDVTTDAGLSELEKRIDLESFIDYYAVQLYIDRRNDWPYMNFALWRSRDAQEGEYGDCRWRWILFDDNSGAYGPASVSSNSIANTREVDYVLDNLLRSPKIDERLRQKMLGLSENEFEPGRVSAFVDEYYALTKGIMHNEFERFYGNKRDYDKFFESRVYRFSDYFEKRSKYVKEHLEEL